MAVVRVDIDINAKGGAAIKEVAASMENVGKAALRAGDAILQGIGQGIGQKAFETLLNAAKAVPAALLSAAKAVMDLGGNLIDTAAKTGMTVEAIQELTYAGSLVGVTFDEIAGAVAKMQANLINAPEKFERLGLSAKALREMKPEDQFTAIAEQIGKIEDPAARSAAAIEMFGKGGVALMPLLTSNVRDAREEAERLGLVMSTGVAAAADDLGDKVDTLSMVWDGLTRNLGAAIVTSAPLQELFSGLIQLVADLSREVSGGQGVLRSFIDSGVLLLVNALSVLLKVVGAVIDIWSGLRIAMQFVAAGFELVAAKARFAYEVMSNPGQLMAAWDRMVAKQQEIAAKVKASVDAEVAANSNRTDALVRVQKAVDAMAEKVQNAMGKTYLGADAAKKHGDTLDYQARKAAEAAAAARKLKEELDFQDKVTQGVLATIKYYNDAAREMAEADAEAARIKEELRQEILAVSAALFGQGVAGWQAYQEAANDAMGDYLQWAADTQALGEAIQDLGDAFGSGLVGDVGAAIAAFAEWGARAAQAETMAQKLTVAIGALSSAYKGGAQASTAFGAALQGMVKGAQAGSVFGIWGAVIGGVVGAIAGLIGKAKAAAEEMRKMRDQFIASVGGMDALIRKAKEAGVALDALFKAKNAEALRKAINDIKTALDDWDEAQRALQEAMDRYGITINELGPAWVAQDLDRKAQQLYKDYMLLVGAGMDVVAVIKKMGPAIQEYVLAAIKAGIAIPSAMKPIIDEMIRQGLLFDENGNKITDAEKAGIKYTDSLSDGMAKVVAAVERLIAALMRIAGIKEITVPVTIKSTWKGPKIPGKGDGGDDEEPSGYGNDEESPGNVGGGQGAAVGFYSPRLPRDTTFRAHEGEEVSIRPKNGPGPSGMPSAAPVHVHVTVKDSLGGPDRLQSFIVDGIRRRAIPIPQSAVVSGR